MKKSSFFKSDVLIFIIWIYIDLVSLEKFCSPLFPYWFYFSLEKVAANAKKSNILDNSDQLFQNLCT